VTKDQDDRQDTGRRLRVRRASEIKPRATRWLWAETDTDGTAQWVPLGDMTLVGGREGVGKSTIVYQVAAKITRGELPGAFYGQPMSVIVSATEDAWEQTIVPRLMANDAALDRVIQVDAVTPEGAPEGIKLPDDLAELETLIRDEGVVLVLLDP
jgi:AAA domain